MLDNLKKVAFKAIGGIFVALLVLSFAIWGIGDVFRGGLGGNTLVSVGPFEVTLPEAENAFEQRLRTIRERNNQSITRDQAMALGLGQNIVSELVTERLVEAHAQSLGITVDDGTLVRIVSANPAFQVNGAFSHDRFQQLLAANGLTEAAFLDIVRQEELRRLLYGTITLSARAPDALLRVLWDHRNEERTGRALVVLPDKLTDIPNPTDEQLQDFVTAHRDEFRTPEYRAFTVLTMQPSDLVGEVNIADEQVRQAYDARAGEFRTPEQRLVTQISAPDDATLQEVKRRLDAGKTTDAVAAAMADRGVGVVDLGSIKKGSFPDAAAETAIFALPAGGISEPVQTAFGKALFQVRAVTPETATPFEEKREELRLELATAQATDELPSLENVVQDAIAGGASLEDAATKGGFKTRKIEPVSAQGTLKAGGAVEPALPDGVLAAAFATGEGVASPLANLPDGGAFIVRVDQVEPARDQTLDEARAVATAQWFANARSERAKAVATELAAQVKAGRSFDELVAGRQDLAITPVGPAKRGDPGQASGLGSEAVRVLFETRPGATAEAPVEVQTGWALIATDGSTPAKAPESLDPLRREVEQAMIGDAADSYRGELLRRFPPVVHDRAMANFTRTSNTP